MRPALFSRKFQLKKPLAPPSATSNPVIVSSAVVGIPMAVVRPSSTGTVTSWGYQWNKGGSPISGATGATYTAVTGDAQEAALTCSMTPFNGSSAGNTVTSAPVVVAPASAAYATALAAVTDGQYFTAPSAANSGARLRVYQRVSGVGVLVDVTPASGTVNSAAAAVRTLALPAITPLVDFDSTDAFYGEGEFQNRKSGASLRTLNLLGRLSHITGGYAVQGAPTITGRQTDSKGGTLGTRIAIASGAAAATDVNFPTRIPPGTWTLAFDAIAITSGSGASTQAIKFGYNALSTLVTANLTTSWQTFSQTFNVTTEGAFSTLFVHGEYPSAASTNYDFCISNLRLTPGASIGADADTESHPSIYTSTDIAYNGMELESLVYNTASGNMLSAKLASVQNLTGYTLMVTIRGDADSVHTGALYSVTNQTSTGTAYHLQKVLSGQSQTSYSSSLGSTAVRDTNWTSQGRITYAIVVCNTDGTSPVAGVPSGVLVYRNGLLIENVKVGLGAQSNVAALALMGVISTTNSVNGFACLGDYSSATFWGQALTDAQVLDAHNVHLTRATAKGLSLTPMTSVLLACGDSITYGLQDSTCNGYVNRAIGSITTPAGFRVPVAMHAVVGNNFSQLVTRMNATMAVDGYQGILQQVNAFVAAGIRPIVSVMIGTNDDANLTSQSAVEQFYAGNWQSTGYGLKSVWSTLRAAGAKVIPCTLLPDNRGYVFESGTGAVLNSNGSGTGAISATTVSNAAGLNGQSFIGWRAYLNALIMSDSSLYDAVADLAAESHFAGLYSGTNGGVPTGIYTDTLHPNALGNSYMAVPFATAVSSLVV